MRKLHPTGPREIPVARGRLAVPGGGEEVWTAHRGPAGRTVVRVEDSSGCLWYLAVDEAGRPERLQARLRDGAGSLDATFTFFDDEVLVWRRGGGSASEAIPMPTGYGLVWPPFAGRGLLLAAAPGEAEWPLWCLERVDLAAGGLVGRLESVHLIRRAGTVEVHRGDGAVETVEVGPAGTVLEWDGPAGRAVELAGPKASGPGPGGRP